MASHPFDYDNDPMRMVSNAREFDRMYRNNWDDRDENRRRVEERHDLIRYGLGLLHSLVPRDDRDMTAEERRFRRAPDNDITRAVEAIEHAIRNAEHHKHDSSDARRMMGQIDNIKNQIVEKSKTIVSVTFTEEIDAWAKEQMPNRYQIVKDGSLGYFLFEDMQSAALFKLQWG